jgi:hypothetical protein
VGFEQSRITMVQVVCTFFGGLVHNTVMKKFKTCTGGGYTLTSMLYTLFKILNNKKIKNIYISVE